MEVFIVRKIKAALLLLFLFVLVGCSQSSDSSNSNSATRTNESAGSTAPSATDDTSSARQQTSSTNLNAAQPNAAPSERKIIRNATLTLESDKPAEGGQRIATIAEQSGGYVATTETRQRGDEDAGGANASVIIEIRVPSQQFNAALEKIRGLGNRVSSEKITGQDVTEEYLDLEARIRAKQALEAQFLEIMKTARTVRDALEVQTQLAEVRTEIERLQGRLRYLENQTSLSTIRVTIETPAPLVATRTSGFFRSLGRAFGDGIDAAATILLVLLRIFIALIPIVLFIFLPIFLLLRYFMRRLKRQRLAAKLQSTPDERGAQT